jgi:soluble lytic murein transglycosylase
MATQKPLENIPIPRLCFVAKPSVVKKSSALASLVFAGLLLFCGVIRASVAQTSPAKAAPAGKASQRASTKSSDMAETSPSGSRFAAEARQLTLLSRALKKEQEKEQQTGQEPGVAYDRLAKFARAHAKEELGERAALALGYSDYNDGRYQQAREWLDIAKPEKLLPDYILFWSAQVDRNLNNNAAALDQLQALRRDYPQSTMDPLALQALVETAIALNQPQTALDALASAKAVDADPTLLFLRAQAHEQANDKIAAAGDYLEVYDRYPLSTQADEAGQKIALLQTSLGAAFPQPQMPERLLRANTLFEAHRWQDAENAYNDALPKLDGPDEDLAHLRIADCIVQLGGDPSLLASAQFQSQDVDAERLYYLSQAYRSANNETSMLATLGQAMSRAPTSQWTERTLFAVGNYYWVKLDRDKAAAEYQQVVDKFPNGDDAINAQWRVAWAAYMDRSDTAYDLMEKFLEAHPDSSYTPDALYWLGRLALREKKTSAARAYFRKLEARFPNTYFAMHAVTTLRSLHNGPIATLPVLDAIPPVPPAREVLKSVPSEAIPFVQRSVALETIGFDDSAVLELRAAYDATSAPTLAFSLARAASNGEHYGAAIAAIRGLYPSIESREFAVAPREAWTLSFPLAYAVQIRSDARRTHTDPMIIAGLIHQESAFEKDAHSYANAFGLMQLVPETAERYARQLRLGFSEDQLLDPVYNLRLGTAYFGELMHSFHSAEAALAAYNAGEDRVALWQSGQKYTELPEFVESIPFTQTREYVEIVMRNAAIYRRLYGGGGK